MDIQFVLSSLTAFAEILFFGGIIFGFSSLQYVLELNGYFEYLCNNSEKHVFFDANTTNNITNSLSRVTCPEQAANFNFVFTIGSSFLFVAGFPWGYLLLRNFFFYHGFADLLRHILCPNLQFRTPLSILT